MKDWILILCAVGGPVVGFLISLFNLRKHLVSDLRAQLALEADDKKGSGIPQPFIVRESQRYATHEELVDLELRLNSRVDDLSESVKRLSEKVEHHYQMISVQGSDRAEKLHRRIDEVLKAVSKVEGRCMAKDC